jgi:hypothetical protein
METVQLQCGHCMQLMAIAVEHLGGQVQCPHCHGVVQTPPNEAGPPPAASMPNMELHQRENILTGTEASDAVIGETAAPKVELPSPLAANAAPAPIAQDGGPAPEPDADLTKFKRRPVFDKSVFALYGLIFLVPYAILTTLAILYLLFMQTGRTHPFDMMPDPVPDPKKGGAKQVMRIKHTYPLADHQKTTLGNSIRVGKDGDLLVTPERVILTEDGDLKLVLRAKNISTNTTFDPINDFWLLYDPKKTSNEPYTFLESKSGNVGNIYGAFLEYRKKSQGKDDTVLGSAVLSPEQETTIVLRTPLEYQKSHIPLIAKSTDSYTWRVQLRRGFVKWRGKEVSATAVIGVEFTSAQIEKKS